MGGDGAGGRTQYLLDVEPKEFAVAAQRVALADGLVGEAEPRHVEDTHPVGDAEFADDVAPVDAAGRKAMHHQQ